MKVLNFLLAFSAILTFIPKAQAIRETGGGGSWTCREFNRSIRWSRFVDLFEAESEFGLKVAPSSGNYEAIVAQMATRLNRVSPKTSALIVPFLATINNFHSAQVHFTDDTLEVIDDSKYIVRPNVERCAGGILIVDLRTGESSIPYEQMVNYKPDGSILVQSALFEHLSETDKAALVFHEAIYAYRRLKLNDHDSRISRKAVAYLFSSSPDADVAGVLNALFAIPPKAANSPDWNFITIPAGSFRMTGREPSPYAVDVTISEDFEIQTTQVTQLQWFRATGLIPPIGQSEQFRFTQDFCPNSFMKTNNGDLCVDYPASGVSRIDIETFIADLNKKDSVYTYRLPTEAEWTYAATAGGESDFPFGGNWNPKDFIWLDGRNGYGTGSFPDLHPVAKKSPNPWQLYDMYAPHFLADWFQETPEGGVDPHGPISGKYHVRGGCESFSPASYCESRPRQRDYLNDSGHDLFRGFRLVRTLKR